MPDVEETQPNPKYAKVEQITDSLLTRLVASPWTGPISGVLILVLISLGIWLGS